MISASAVQELLLGAGGFLGTSMAGIGAYRLFAAATRGVTRIPSCMESGAESLARVVRAIETQNLVSGQVLELKALLMTTREEILKMSTDRELIGRELRLMSRKIDGFSCYANEEYAELAR